MLHAVLTLAMMPLVTVADVTLPAPTQLNYRGTLAPADENAGDENAGDNAKTFDLTLWILSTSETGCDVFWLVDERGQGGFPWPSRYGRAALDAQLQTSAAAPAVLYDRGEGPSAVPVAWPLLACEKPLQEGQSFSMAGLDYTVERAVKRGERAGWRLTARDAYGPKRTVVVQQVGPLLLESEQRLTLGRGEPYRLRLELVSNDQLSGDDMAAIARAAQAFEALRNKLNVPPRTEQVAWRAEQAETLAQELPAVAESAAGTPLARLATAAQRDLELQSGRQHAVTALQARFVGQTVEDFALRGTAGESLDAPALKDHVTILHFWDYRDEPLREPYGQVGYLDFLYHRHKAAGLRVYGVAVNPRLGDQATRGSATLSAKKLKTFMNLSYPVLLDDGALLRQFGDPRVVGASLPLFVVVGPDGTIRHYHVGTYEVQQDQGLKELDTVAAELLGKG